MMCLFFHNSSFCLPPFLASFEKKYSVCFCCPMFPSRTFRQRQVVTYLFEYKNADDGSWGRWCLLGSCRISRYFLLAQASVLVFHACLSAVVALPRACNWTPEDREFCKFNGAVWLSPVEWIKFSPGSRLCHARKVNGNSCVTPCSEAKIKESLCLSIVHQNRRPSRFKTWNL